LCGLGEPFQSKFETASSISGGIEIIKNHIRERKFLQEKHPDFFRKF
jgi:hypothetical protein